MTECKSNDKQEQGQLLLDLGFGKEIEAKFDGDGICTDGGLLLLRKADEKLELTELAAFCIRDGRRADLVKHKLRALLRQRIYAIAAGYEDCNDAGKLAVDVMHRMAVGYLPSDRKYLASQPTLSRWENCVDEVALKALQQLLVHTYIRRIKKRPKLIRLAMDTTCDEVHGYQQLSFYNGFYQTDCYVPLFIFDDEGCPLAALLRPGNAGTAEGGLRMLREVVQNLRLAWPGVVIELTADAGFCTPELYEYCENNKITYYIGIKSNAALAHYTKQLVVACKAHYEEFGLKTEPLKHMSAGGRTRVCRQKEERVRFASKAEGRMQEHFEDELVIRKFSDFKYDAREWSHARRIIARCDFTSDGPDLRYVVTNAQGGPAKRLYEEKYCRRARCENWIKDLKNYLKCDRTSCQEFNANQFRLLLHTFAYMVLLEVRKQAGLQAATMETVRLQLIKVGVLVKETARRVCLHLASDFPWQKQYAQAWQHL
jgi:hypothetical protein